MTSAWAARTAPVDDEGDAVQLTFSGHVFEPLPSGALWWAAELAPRIVLTTAPGAPRTHWEQLYLPLLDPITMAAGETLLATVRSRSSPAAGTNIAWSAAVSSASGKTRQRQSLDLEKGYLP